MTLPERLLQATETELVKVKTMVAGTRGTLRNAPAGKIGERAGKVINKYKMAKHFELEISDGSFSYQRKTEQIATEAALDGLYVIRTTCRHPTLTSQATVRAYKQLKMAERAFHTIKTRSRSADPPSPRRPCPHPHAFLCMLAYYVSFRTTLSLPRCCSTTRHRRLPPTPSPQPDAHPTPSKAGSHRPPETDYQPTPSPTCSTNSPPYAATPCASPPPHTFTRLTTPNPVQAKALALLDVKLGK